MMSFLVFLWIAIGSLHDAAPRPELVGHETAHSIEFQLQGNLIVLSAFINGVDKSFILDTGASQSVVAAAAARDLNLKGVQKQVGRGAGGDVIGSLVRIDSLRVGNSSVRDLTFIIMDLDMINERIGGSVSGVIGFDFLSQFKLTIDYRNRRLTLDPYAVDQPSKDNGPHIEEDTFRFKGIELTRTDKSWRFITETPLPQILVILRKEDSSGKITLQSQILHGLTLTAIAPSVEVSLQSQVKQFRKVSEEFIQINGTDYYSVEYRGVEEGKEQRYMMMISKPGDSLYTIRFQSAPSDFDRLIDDFHAILRSISYR